LRAILALIRPENDFVYRLIDATGGVVATGGGSSMATKPLPPGAHDFDFLHGTWRVANRRLVSRLTNSDEWDQFEAVNSCWPILGGMGNVETARPISGRWQGFEGSSHRLFDPVTGLWSIYWADNVKCQLTPPVVGRFEQGAGEFYGDDLEGGTAVRVRFRWTGTDGPTPRWEQAFSTDGGTTWELNWTMAFSRAETS
jgi:hypothetical protein